MCVLFILLLLHSHWFSSRHFQVTFRALRIRQDLNINMASSTRRSFGQGELSGRPFARSHGSANYNDGRGQFGQRFSHGSESQVTSQRALFESGTTTGLRDLELWKRVASKYSTPLHERKHWMVWQRHLLSLISELGLKHVVHTHPYSGRDKDASADARKSATQRDELALTAKVELEPQ